MAPLGPSWAPLGLLLAPLVLLLAALRPVLDSSWRLLGPSWAPLDSSWVPRRTLLGSSGILLYPNVCVGQSQARFWAVLVSYVLDSLCFLRDRCMHVNLCVFLGSQWVSMWYHRSSAFHEYVLSETTQDGKAGIGEGRSR